MRSATSRAGERSRATEAQRSRSTAACSVEASASALPSFSTKTRRTHPPGSLLNSKSTTSAPCARTIGSTIAASRSRLIDGGSDGKLLGASSTMENDEIQGKKNAAPRELGSASDNHQLRAR